MPKAKMTGFTKFLLLMIIVGPLAFFGASYYRGEDGFGAIKSLFNKSENTSSEKDDVEKPKVAKSNGDDLLLESKIKRYEDELIQKNKLIDSLYLENTRISNEYKLKIKELEQSKVQLEKVKSVLNK